jgi:signal transduction histidine kinase/ABC-type uncharacterized transport system substrate-binding protein
VGADHECLHDLARRKNLSVAHSLIILVGTMVARRILKIMPAIVALALPLACAGSFAWAQQRWSRTALTVQFGPVDSVNNVSVRSAIDQALQSRSELPVESYAEFLRSDRLSEEEASIALRDYIRTKYRGRSIDVVIADNTLTLQFVLRNREELFPNSPIVFSALAAPDESTRAAGAGLTGVVFGDIYRETVDLATKLRPSTKRIFFVAQVPNTDLTRSYQNLVRSSLREFAPRLEINFLTAPTLAQLIAAIKAVPDDSLVFFVEYVPDDDPGRLLAAPWPERLVAEEAKVPVFGFFEAHIGSGIVGGNIRGAQRQGMRLGDLAIQVLAGTRASDIPIERLVPQPVFDSRALQRWGIHDAQLPAGSDIRYRSPTVWELYRWYFVAMITTTALQTLLIGGLIVQRVRRQKAENEIRTKERELRTSYERSRQLAGQLITAQEEERTRIARELHDDVGQRVASLSIGLSGLKRRVQNAERPVQDELSALQKQTMALATDLRNLSHELHPGALEHVGLIEALRGRCEEVSIESQINVRLEVADGWSDVADDIALCLYRVTQEALRNIVKHAQARTAIVSLARLDGLVTMQITDDGHGFEANGSAEHHGLGLLSIGERVRMLGGSFGVQSSRSAGTVATVRLPVGGVLETASDPG